MLWTMALHFWMLKTDTVWVTPMQAAHESYVKKQELTTDVDRSKMDPIQCDI